MGVRRKARNENVLKKGIRVHVWKFDICFSFCVIEIVIFSHSSVA